jgi:PKD repeat protein
MESIIVTIKEAGTTVDFKNVLPDPGLWLFGDGGFSNCPNPTHTYATPGTYRAKQIPVIPKE